MYDFDQLSDVKSEFIEALKRIPAEFSVSIDSGGGSPEVIDVSQIVSDDINHLDEFWQSVNDYRFKKVIALVGMVNVGKSALGNYLLSQGESEVFQEASIRETADAKEAFIDNETLLIDLPGLGSVLWEEDDTVVRNVIRRANLLILVLDVSYPIPKYLYDFICSKELIKNQTLQKIIVVINKIDCLCDLPKKAQRNQIERYKKFLKTGNERMGFEGISTLFDYEIPMIPFSVMDTRYRRTRGQGAELRRLIRGSLEASVNNAALRADAELLSVGEKYKSIVQRYHMLCERQVQYRTEISQSKSNISAQVVALYQKNFASLAKRINDNRNDCIKEMNSNTTTSAERFWKGENFNRKKNRIRSARERHQDAAEREFKTFISNVSSGFLITVRSKLSSTFDFSLPNDESIISELRKSIYEVWDAFDDYWFLDKEKHTLTRSLNQSDEHRDKAIALVGEWAAEFCGNFDNRLNSEFINTEEYKKLVASESEAHLLEPFVKSLLSIGYFNSVFQ